MLLLDLVKEHGIDEVVIDGLGLAGFRIILHQIGIDLGHLFGDETVLERARPVGVFGLVIEGDGPELHEAVLVRPCPESLPCIGARKWWCRAVLHYSHTHPHPPLAVTPLNTGNQRFGTGTVADLVVSDSLSRPGLTTGADINVHCH